MAITVRAARHDDIPMLQKDLARDKRWEQVDLTKGIVFVVEKDGDPKQFIQARLMWQIEPLKWIRGKRKTCNAHEQRKATALAIMAMEDHLANRTKNPFIRSYFCTIRNKKMQKLAESFGMFPLYVGNKMYGKDL